MRPRPVLIFGMVLAALTAVTTYADAENIIPNPWLNWLRVATAVLGAAGAFYVQTKTTPLSDPKANDGTPLVPNKPQQ